MKFNIKKGLAGLLTGLVFAINSYGGVDLPKGYDYFDKENYYRFNKTITAVKISKGKKVGWLIYDTRNKEVIGDEKDELNEYKRYAAMAESKNIMNSLKPEDVNEMASLYRRGLAGYEIAYKIPNFVLEKGSNLEGKLLKHYFTGGKDLDDEKQKELVKKLINEEKKEIIDNFYKNIFGDKEEINPIEAVGKVRDYLTKTIEWRMTEASLKLNRSAEILEKSKNKDLSYNEYKEFLDNFIEGNSTGRAYLNAIDRIQNNVNWKTLTQKIVKNLSEGLEIKDDIEKVSMHTNDLLDIDLAGIVFGDGDFMDVFDDVEKEYIKEREKWFKNVEGRYSLEKNSVSMNIISDLGKEKSISKKENILEKEKPAIKEKKSKREKEGDIHNTNIMRRKFCYDNKLNKILDENKCRIGEFYLNDDNIPEFIMGKYCTDRCIISIFSSNGNLLLDSYREGIPPILRRKSKTNGYYDLEITRSRDTKCKSVEGLSLPRSFELFIFNGYRYIESGWGTQICPEDMSKARELMKLAEEHFSEALYYKTDYKLKYKTIGDIALKKSQELYQNVADILFKGFPQYYIIPTLSKKEDALINLRLGEICYFKYSGRCGYIRHEDCFEDMERCKDYLDTSIKLGGDSYPETYYYLGEMCERYEKKNTKYNCKLKHFSILEEKEGKNGFYYSRFRIGDRILTLQSLINQPK